MNFTEFGFWPRLFIGLLILFCGRFLVPKRSDLLSVYDRLGLGCLSLYLLSCVGKLTFFIFLSVFLTTWMLVQVMFSLPPSKRKYVLWGGVPLLCLPLLYYKYRLFIAHDILGLDGVSFATLAIPAGISFYTFQKIAMLVDASRMGEWRPKFLDYLNFASFFPQVVAGPIERKSALFPQMESFSFECHWPRLNEGAPWLALGLFYKLCLADNLSPLINPDLISSAWTIAYTTFLFGLKIYFDFCGYSLIALGLGRCLGVNLSLNFKSPYWAGNIRDFWRRWHTSLSYWFRDYIYIPLGGSLTRVWAFNLMVVFVVSGIWHGAGWGFIIWGAAHGAFSVISHFFKGKFRLPWLLGWPMTLLCVFLAWLPFYETRIEFLKRKFAILLDPKGWAPVALADLARTQLTPGAIGTILLCLIALSLEGIARYRNRDDYSYASHPMMIVGCVFAIIFLGGLEANEFVYFAF